MVMTSLGEKHTGLILVRREQLRRTLDRTPGQETRKLRPPDALLWLQRGPTRVEGPIKCINEDFPSRYYNQ